MWYYRNEGREIKLLVTGSSGFIGTNFCERFHASRKYDLVGLDCKQPTERFSKVEYVLVNLCDREAVREAIDKCEPEVILHFAAQARVEPSYLDPIGTYDTNVTATINLLSAALQEGKSFDRFFYASSETVYGHAAVYPTPENSMLKPQSAYAASKAASEVLVRNAHGLRSVILRSAMGYGPRSNPKQQVVAKFILKALKDEPICFPQNLDPSAHPTRDMNYVENFVEGVEMALKHNVEGTYNIASGTETSILNLAEQIVDLTGRGHVRFDPSYRYRPGEVGLRTWLDISRARDDFSYQPKVSLKEGLERAFSWLKDHLDYWDQEESLPIPVRARIDKR